MPSEADATAAGLRVETVSDTAIGERRKGPQQTEVFRRTPRWFRAASWVLQRVAWRARMAEYALPLIEREAVSTVRVPWWRRPALWRRGFLGESAVLYDLRGAKAADYLSDRERFLGTRLINGDRAVLLDDKLLFDRLLEPFPELKPRQFGLLDGHRVRPPEDVGRGGEMLDLDGLLEREGKLVVKPSSGGGGKGFLLLEAGPEGGRRVNGQAATADDLAQLGRLSDRLMVMEHVDQHPALEALYPRTTNTLRLLTMLDEEGRSFLACGVLRIGCARSEPTDNWSRGGLSAAIDLESGRIGQAASYPAGQNRLTWHSLHPDSGQQIEGLALPQWDRIAEQILEVAEALPFLPYVGWDVVPSADGCKILEGNSYSDANLLQIHGPLMSDPRVRDFYRRHGAVRR